MVSAAVLAWRVCDTTGLAGPYAAPSQVPNAPVVAAYGAAGAVVSCPLLHHYSTPHLSLCRRALSSSV